jgi:hypothetical protein
MAKSKEASGRPRRKKDGLYIMAVEDHYFVCVWCEVIQKIKTASNHLRVCKKYLEECGRHEQVDRQKKDHV